MYLIAARFSWSLSTVSAGMSPEDKKSNWWLLIKLSADVEPSKVLLLENAKSTFDMISISQEVYS